MRSLLRRLAVAAALVCSAASAFAWDYAGHRIVNQLALAGLPADFPAFVREPAAAERIAFLAGEPDRWRNNPDLPIKHYNGLDHYIDIEYLPAAGLDPATVSPLRYQFVADFAAGYAANRDKFAAYDPAKNADGTRQWPGFLPWAVTEYYGKLKSAFSYLKTLEELGRPDEIANAQANILYLMGVMGHYVGDGCQPLHITEHHNGWVGENPHGYTTSSRIHSFIDGGFIAQAGITYAGLEPRAKPARPLIVAGAETPRDPMFDAVMSYVQTQHLLVEPLYKLEKEGKLDPSKPEFVGEGKAFIEKQLLEGGAMLASIWLTAWQNTVPDTYLRGELLKRREAEAAAKSAAAPAGE